MLSVAGLRSWIASPLSKRRSVILTIEIADFRRVATAHPDAWRHLALLEVENHARTMGFCQDLMVRGCRARLLAILARLDGLHEKLVPEPAVIDATQEEVADIANLSRSVVSRYLQDMERKGLIRLRRKTIEVVDARRLLHTA